MGNGIPEPPQGLPEASHELDPGRRLGALLAGVKRLGISGTAATSNRRSLA